MCIIIGGCTLIYLPLSYLLRSLVLIDDLNDLNIPIFPGTRNSDSGYYFPVGQDNLDDTGGNTENSIELTDNETTNSNIDDEFTDQGYVYVKYNVNLSILQSVRAFRSTVSFLFIFCLSFIVCTRTSKLFFGELKEKFLRFKEAILSFF